jgi:hypothetical protein
VDFWDATKVLFRRWYVALPLLLLAIGGSAYTAVAVKPDYVLTSYIQLVPPSANPDKVQDGNTPRNPWNQLGVDALSEAANYATIDQTFLDTLQAGGYSTNFTTTVGAPPAGATVQVVGKTRKQAIETTDMVFKRYQDSAQKLQSRYGVRSQDMITTQRLDQGENLKRPGGKVKRAIIAVFGTGMLLTVASTIAVDAVIRRRRRRGDSSDEVAGAAVERAPAARNGSRAPMARDFEAETVRVLSGEYRSLAATARAGSARSGSPRSAAPKATAPKATAPNAATGKSGASKPSGGFATNGSPGTEAGPTESIPTDVTIVLPLPHQWAPGDHGDSRR